MHPLRAIWEDARQGKYEIWTSAYSHLEVFKVKNDSGDPLPAHLSVRPKSDPPPLEWSILKYGF